MIQLVAIVIVVVLAGVLLLAARRPSTFRVSRSVRIHASPDAIAPHLTDFRRWAAWSPYEKLDPTMQKTFSGTPSGPGSVYEWHGNNKAGTGRMTMLTATASGVSIDLRFEKPWKAQNVASFTLEPAGDATTVTWAMDGASPFMLKVMGLFMNMDQMIGRDFEAGLASLKAIAERAS